MHSNEKEELRQLQTKLSLARANGDPAKYMAGITVEEAHRIAYFLTNAEMVCDTDGLISGGFQDAVGKWITGCFGKEIALDPVERCDRFIEEALELAQTFPMFTRERAHTLVDYVFDREVGDQRQEIGGVMICLAAMANITPFLIGPAANSELRRIQDPETQEKIRAKHATKATIHA